MIESEFEPGMGLVSIIMKVWNAREHVRLCLKTLLQHTDDPFELIVIDNGSQPEVVQFLRATASGDPRIRLIENPANVGPGHANRQGAALAKGRTICLIDSDVLVPHHWLVRLVAEFEKHPAVKLLAPLTYHQTLSHPFGPDNSAAAWFRTKAEQPQLAPLRQFHVYSGGLSIDEFDELMCSAHAQALLAEECPPMFIGTCCALLDADFVAAAGGVADPRFARYGSEDADLCWRIGEQSGQIARTTAVYVHHFHHSSLIDNAVDSDAALRQANRILYAKWKPKLIGLVQAEMARGGSLRDYLGAHFIFQPLSQHTSFVADLRAATQCADIPDHIVWKPAPVLQPALNAPSSEGCIQKTRRGSVSLPLRSDIRSGVRVQIVEKQNQRSGAVTEGIVARILTSSPAHPHGIKVMLADGRVGRVKAILATDA